MATKKSITTTTTTDNLINQVKAFAKQCNADHKKATVLAVELLATYGLENITTPLTIGLQACVDQDNRVLYWNRLSKALKKANNKKRPEREGCTLQVERSTNSIIWKTAQRPAVDTTDTTTTDTTTTTTTDTTTDTDTTTTEQSALKKIFDLIKDLSLDDKLTLQALVNASIEKETTAKRKSKATK